MPPLTKNPPYVVINNDEQSKELKSVLVTKAQPIEFPMSEEDRTILEILEDKFDKEENCAGLAAPQIGFPKQIIVFAAPITPEMQKWRPDLTQSMPKTIWINPQYEPIGDELNEDYEGCFSVHDIAGTVKRYKQINYSAYLPDGTPVLGTAEGFLARIIQHEVDHLNGVLFTDKIPKKLQFSISEYREVRAKKMSENK